MPLTIQDIRDRIAQVEQEFEAAKSHVFRCDGALQVLRHQLAQLEAEDSGSSEPAPAE